MNKKGVGGFGERRKDINRAGRPKGHTPLEELKQAIRDQDAGGSGSLLKRYLDLALTDRTVLLDVMRKLYPNAQSLEISGGLTLQDIMSKLRGEAVNDSDDNKGSDNEETNK